MTGKSKVKKALKEYEKALEECVDKVHNLFEVAKQEGKDNFANTVYAYPLGNIEAFQEEDNYQIGNLQDLYKRLDDDSSDE